MNRILILAEILLLTGIASAGTSYVHGADGLLAKVNETGVFYYHPDHLGSTSAMTREGEIIEEQITLPFGQPLAGGEKYGFTGKEFNPDTGLNYFGARFYNPKIGRFIQVDPVLEDFSSYAYVGNNPLTYVDPSGGRKEKPGFGSRLYGATIGAALRGAKEAVIFFPYTLPKMVWESFKPSDGDGPCMVTGGRQGFDPTVFSDGAKLAGKELWENREGIGDAALTIGGTGILMAGALSGDSGGSGSFTGKTIDLGTVTEEMIETIELHKTLKTVKGIKPEVLKNAKVVKSRKASDTFRIGDRYLLKVYKESPTYEGFTIQKEANELLKLSGEVLGPEPHAIGDNWILMDFIHGSNGAEMMGVSDQIVEFEKVLKAKGFSFGDNAYSNYMYGTIKRGEETIGPQWWRIDPVP